MSKLSQRHPVRYDHSGCMWGLISILDFRNGSRTTRKLLADKRRGSKQSLDAEDMGRKPELSTDAEENVPGDLGNEESYKITEIDAPSNRPTVKTLMEEEMVVDPKLHPELHEEHKKHRKRSKRDSRGSTGMNALNLNSSKCPFNHTPNDGSVNKQNVNDILLEEFCNHLSQRDISEVCLELKPKNCDLDVGEKLHHAIRDFISRDDANERVNFSDDVVGALQNLSLNKESFLKLLRDPSSISVKDTEISSMCMDDRVKDPGELVSSKDNNSKQRKFFRTHAKSLKIDEKGLNSDTIVILKPAPDTLKSCATEGGSQSSSRTQHAEKARDHFFLGEIRRRWKSVMGKEQNPEDSVVKSPKSPSKDHFFIEKMAKPRESNCKRVPDIYVEAKRHLSDMLRNGHDKLDSSSSGAKSPKTLARILALSEFNSPVVSPRAQMMPVQHSNDKFEKVGVNVDPKTAENGESCLSSSTPSEGTGPSITVARDVEIEENASSDTREDMKSDYENARNMVASDECIESIQSSETSNQDDETQMPRKEVVHNDRPPVPSFESPPSSCTKNTAEASEISKDKPERTSPVSVLEPLLMEEAISPERNASRTAELWMEPMEIKFEDENDYIPLEQGNLFKIHIETKDGEEALMSYIRHILRSCGLINWHELYLKSQSSDHLLDLSLYGEDGLFCNHPQYDQNLVLDCINEAFLEVINQYFRFVHQESFTKPIMRHIPSSEASIHEVCELVRRRLLVPMPMPRTLDEVVSKDMGKSDKWMDLRPDAETVVFEMGDEILDELIEDYVDESLQSLRGSNYAEISGHESFCFSSSDSHLFVECC